MRFFSTLAITVGGAAMIASCVESISFPKDASRFEPPARYRALWRSIEDCSGRTRSFNGVSWYVTEGSVGGQSGVTGVWYEAGNRIVLSRSVLENDLVVRHEMLHAILKSGHRRQFLNQCGGLVMCARECRSEAGGSPEATPTFVTGTPAHLDVRLHVRSPVSDDSGWVSILVEANNRLSSDLVVQHDPSSSVRFECAINGTRCPGFVETGAQNVHFAAGWGRRYSKIVQLEPGTYQITGRYNSALVAAQTIVVP